jgi:hypothetical protein
MIALLKVNFFAFYSAESTLTWELDRTTSRVDLNQLASG